MVQTDATQVHSWMKEPPVDSPPNTIGGVKAAATATTPGYPLVMDRTWMPPHPVGSSGISSGAHVE